MHFLRALYSGKPKEHGYLIRPDFHPVPFTGSKDLELLPGSIMIFLDPEGYPAKLLINPEKSMVISFFDDYSGRPMDLIQNESVNWSPRQSELSFTSKKCLVRYNGTTFDYSLLFTGYIGEQKISRMLPDDFMLEE